MPTVLPTHILGFDERVRDQHVVHRVHEKRDRVNETGGTEADRERRHVLVRERLHDGDVVVVGVGLVGDDLHLVHEVGQRWCVPTAALLGQIKCQGTIYMYFQERPQ